MGIIINLVILIFSAIIHEVAHGYVAERLGDSTARLMGRLTLDPRKHIDPFLSLVLPLLLIFSGSPVIVGGAKPVPVDPFNLKDGRKDLALVSLSGPLVNVLLAVIASILIHILLPFTFSADTTLINLLTDLLHTIASLNIYLAIFNLLPIPPLDGSKIFALILPERDANTYLSLSSIGMFLLFFLLVFPVGGFSLQNLLFSLYSFSMSLLNL